MLNDARAILRDGRTYTDPLEFKPERFLGGNPETDPRNVCFGLGRRYVRLVPSWIVR